MFEPFRFLILFIPDHVAVGSVAAVTLENMFAAGGQAPVRFLHSDMPIEVMLLGLVVLEGYELHPGAETFPHHNFLLLVSLGRIQSALDDLDGEGVGGRRSPEVPRRVLRLLC